MHGFGGRPLLDAALPTSRQGGRPLHLTLDLDLSDPRLAGLGLRGLDRFAVLAHYHVEPRSGLLAVRHEDRGRRLVLLAEPEGPVVRGVPDELPHLPLELEPLHEAELAVEALDELPDGLRPVHRVGGRPLRASGGPTAPRCPVTGGPMRFVATVDSIPRFPMGGVDRPLIFGDGGLMHVYWSDAASVSAGVVVGG
jgi:hypothetical protein